MKAKSIIKTFTLSLTFIVTSLSIQAQDQVLRTDIKINDQVRVGETKSQAIQVLGVPSQTEQYYSEMDDKYLDKLMYGDSYLLFDNDKLVSFRILDTNLYLKIGSILITHGSNIGTYQSTYPASYNKRHSYNVGPMLLLSIKVIIKSETILLEEYLSIKFDSSTRLVTTIEFVDN